MQKISKIILMILILIILFPANIAYSENDISKEQIDTLNLSNITDDFNIDTAGVVPDFDPDKLIEEISKGNLKIDGVSIINKLIGLFAKEVNNNISIIIKVIIIAIICAVLKSLHDNLSNHIAESAFFICYLIMVSLVIVGFKEALSIGQATINSMTAFMQAIVPMMIGMMISVGNITSASTMHPLLIISLQIISTTISSIMIPVVMLTAVFSIAGNISNKVQISKLGILIRSVSVWIMGIFLTLFVGIVTLESNLAGTIDGVAGKTMKFAFSKSIPIVGQTLSDSVETVLGCSMVIKNSFGVVGIIIIGAIIMVPVIKILAIILTYKFAAVIVQPVANPRISKCLDELGGSLILLFAIMVSIGFMFIVSITAMLNMGNIATMIR